MNDYIVYTDGAYSSALNQGGVGFIVLREGKKICYFSKMYKNTTNNRMEILAVILALESIKSSKSITIYTDSMYVIGCGVKGYKRNKNNDLWKRFDIALNKHPDVTFNHIKGHSVNTYNNECDQLAVSASRCLP